MFYRYPIHWLIPHWSVRATNLKLNGLSTSINLMKPSPTSSSCLFSARSAEVFYLYFYFERRLSSSQEAITCQNFCITMFDGNFLAIKIKQFCHWSLIANYYGNSWGELTWEERRKASSFLSRLFSAFSEIEQVSPQIQPTKNKNPTKPHKFQCTRSVCSHSFLK